MDLDDDYLPLSAVFRYAHCPRQAYLFHVEDQHQENRFTADGNLLHDRVTGAGDEARPGIRICRSLQLVNRRLRVRGVADVVELQGEEVFPVEYKRGAKRSRFDEHAQLALQAICLEEMLGRSVMRGAVYHGRTRRREVVELSSELRARVEALVRELRSCMGSSRPPPAPRAPHCGSCSLVERCQPSVTDGRHSASAWLKKALG